MSSDQQHIDHLLERYLTLLNEYTQLRKELSKLQADVYHNIARANFSGERGMRYGQDHYDDRMRATRRVVIEKNDSDVSVFTVRDTSEEEGASVESQQTEVPEKAAENCDDDTNSAENEDGPEKKSNKRDPLRWFGILTPMALRAAQSQSIKAVDDIIPRLVSVNAEMQHVEIEVRRARKKRAKAEGTRTKGKTEENPDVLLGKGVEAS